MLKLDGRMVRGRVIRVQSGSKVEELAECHVLYVELASESEFKSRENFLQGRPVLTIGDVPGFAKQGGMIELVSGKERLGFEVNLEAAKRANLKLSSQMLALANIVEGS